MRNSINDAIDKLLERLIFPDDGCWIWTGCPRMKYPTISCGTVRLSVHRLAFELFSGPIPDGYDVHHRCENPRCCNPDHLEALTQIDHYRLHKVKSHCKYGHPFSPENTYRSPSRPDEQGCKECRRRHLRESRARRKGPDGRKNRTHCLKGHLFTPENTYTHRGVRTCRECRRQYKRSYRAAHSSL